MGARIPNICIPNPFENQTFEGPFSNGRPFEIRTMASIDSFIDVGKKKKGLGLTDSKIRERVKKN